MPPGRAGGRAADAALPGEAKLVDDAAGSQGWR